MDDDDILLRRLHALGTQPVDPATAATHLTAMATVAPRRAARRSFGHKLRIGAAFAAGLVLGGTGLAAAGALPDGAQQVAHTALSQVKVHVPPGHAVAAAHAKAKGNAKGNGNGKAAHGGGVTRSVAPADCPDWDFASGPPKNHGQYVSAMTDRVRALPEAQRDAAMQRYGESACGKPVHAGTDDDDADHDEQPEVETTTPVTTTP
jgi:hypothetical protein